MSVGGQDPLSPPLLHPTLRTLGLSRGWGPCSPPLCSCPAWEKETGQGKEGAVLSSHIPSGSGHGSPSPNPGLLPGGFPDPSLGPIPPSCWECGFQQRSWKKSKTLHRPPMGDPNLRPRTGCVDARGTPGQAPLLRRLLGLFTKKPPHTPLHKPPLPRSRGPLPPPLCTPHLCSV